MKKPIAFGLISLFTATSILAAPSITFASDDNKAAQIEMTSALNDSGSASNSESTNDSPRKKNGTTKFHFDSLVNVNGKLEHSTYTSKSWGIEKSTKIIIENLSPSQDEIYLTLYRKHTNKRPKSWVIAALDPNFSPKKQQYKKEIKLDAGGRYQVTISKNLTPGDTANSTISGKITFK